MVDGISALSPSQTLPALLAKKLGVKWNVSDASHAGDPISVLVAGELAVNATFDTRARRNELIVWAGTNDRILENDPPDFAALEMQGYITTELSVGWRVTFIACLPCNPGFGPGDEPTFRAGYNGAMLTWCGTHGVRYLDPAQDVRLSDWTNRTYFDDGLHLTPAGEQIVADQVYRLIA